MKDRRTEMNPAVTFRRAHPDDAIELFRVRMSVHENHQTVRALRKPGATEQGAACGPWEVGFRPTDGGTFHAGQRYPGPRRAASGAQDSAGRRIAARASRTRSR